MTVQFVEAFEKLTGNPPFPWQEALYERFVSGDLPKSCTIPTGLGKTNVIVVWLIALMNGLKAAPRRLVYVVNRRTVVDQTTDVVEKLRNKLKEHSDLAKPLRELCAADLDPDEPPLAASTLRGQLADNRAWSADPARPAVIS